MDLKIIVSGPKTAYLGREDTDELDRMEETDAEVMLIGFASRFLSFF